VADISHPGYEEQIGVVNKTLQEIKAFDKPIITIFNKMDLYEETTFDPWLEENTKKEILNDLEERWQHETHGNAIFISAIEKKNIDQLREKILEKVRQLYKIRYPYRAVHF
jgi:GTP-binding protein HflX